MNELDLIKEVEKRPILYDKSVSGFNKTKLRDDAWREVQDALNVSENECKKRWRSLRDSFIKLRRTHGARTRWPYQTAMKFLLPHIEPKAENGSNKSSNKDASDSDGEDEGRQPAAQGLPDLSHGESDGSPSSPKKARRNSSDDENPCQCNRTTDPDELFLVSCAPSLRRLSPKQNAVARLKIQQALYEAEFGCAAEVPYVTPAEYGAALD